MSEIGQKWHETDLAVKTRQLFIKKSTHMLFRPSGFAKWIDLKLRIGPDV